MPADQSTTEITSVGSSTQKNSGGFLGKLKDAFKSPAAERQKQLEATRPPRRDSDEWSYMTDPEDSTKKVKKPKKKMVTYNPYHTQGSDGYWVAKGGRF